MAEAEIVTAINVLCPNCNRKLCKLTNINGQELVEFRHKHAWVLALEMIIKCLDCKKTYPVNINSGIGQEINLE